MEHSLTYPEWLQSFRLIAGGETPPDPEADPAAGGEGDGEGEPDPAGSGDDPAGGNGDGPGDENDGDLDDADLDELDRIKRERDEARTRLAGAEAAARKAKADARKAREEAAKKGGNWEQVAKEREAELQEVNDRATSAESDRATAQEELDKFRREVRVTRIASILSFHDPQDAMAQLANQPESTGDDKSCLRALRKLASDKPYLVDARKARGRAMSGENGATGLTWEQVQSMSEAEVNARWPEVQPVLARGPGG